MRSSPLPVFLILAPFLIQAGCFHFNFSSFQPEARRQLILMSDTNIAFDAIQVTPDFHGAPMKNISARALYNKRFRLRKGRTIASFNTTFVLNIQNHTFPGGEGLAFIITGNSSVPHNSEGRWLGIVNSDTNGTSEAGIVAVEFDTRMSGDGDLDGNHIGLNKNSINSVTPVSLSDFGF